MPKHFRAKCTFPFHDADTKNVACINPTFRHQTWQPFEDPLPIDGDAIAQEIAASLASKLPAVTSEIRVSLYDVEKTKPNYPFGKGIVHTGASPVAVNVVPEASVVLSFYSDRNVPRRRGRLYFPAWSLGAITSNMGREVPSGLITTLSQLPPAFAAIGGGNVDWGVWSARDNAFHKASNWFISTAWATVRSRGITASSRTLGTTSG